MTKTYPCLSLVLISLFASQSRCSCQEEELADLTCTLECYTGPSGTAGTGICRKGANICDEEGNVVGCGDIVPEDEICDGLDNNCNGFLDEGLDLACRTLSPEISGVGVCVPGVKRCVDGRYTQCQGEGMPQEELCDGADNDCDGIVDNILSEPCGLSPNVGRCRRGWTACDNAEAVCYGEIFPQEEVCDGADNDCDGEADEDLVMRCYSGSIGDLENGACAVGESRCLNGFYGSCQGEILPTEEVCNGIDDNCDGFIDNLPQDSPCNYGGAGEGCLNGIMACVNGVPICVPPPSDEEICDNLDNDCNGLIDDGLEVSCYSGPSLTAGVGECGSGVSVCASGEWSECMNETLPEREICDGLDNDCDGVADNNVIFCGDITVFIDQSGSVFDDLPIWLPALRRMADILCPEARLHLVGVPIDSYGMPAVHLNAGNPQTFKNAVSLLSPNRADNENQYGAVYAAIPENNSLGLVYRGLEACETPPFCRKFIMMTDECPQYNGTYCIYDITPVEQSIQIDLAEALTDFDVMFYVFTRSAFHAGWRFAVAGLSYNTGRSYDISLDEDITFTGLKDALLVDCSLTGAGP